MITKNARADGAKRNFPDSASYAITNCVSLCDLIVTKTVHKIHCSWFMMKKLSMSSPSSDSKVFNEVSEFFTYPCIFPVARFSMSASNSPP